MTPDEAASNALLLLDLQNDFIHPRGAYARGGIVSDDIAALPGRLRPVAQNVRDAGSWVVSTHFTLVPGRNGEPFISPHLRALRPFLERGDFTPGSFGHELVEELGEADLQVEKVAYSAFYMTRLEWVLNRADIRHIWVAGIVTNGGVASTVRDAHVRDFRISVIADGCAAFDPVTHRTNIDALRGVAAIVTCDETIQAFTEK